MKLRMDSYLALTVETGESRARKNEVGALGATNSINELMPSHAALAHRNDQNRLLRVAGP